MLRITMNKSAAGAKKYYSEEYYQEGKKLQHDYYSEKEQAIGKWGGKGAELLGLNGDIHKEDFADLCDNKIPGTNNKLTVRNEAGRRVGYDFTFNASKSVSLAYTFGNDEEKKAILNAFRGSVKETMEEIEKGMQTRVRGRGRNENRETGNLVYGEFVHYTTRPIDGTVDCHLHSHIFCFNGTYDKIDRRWKAGQFGQIKQDAPYYEAYFHSKLAERLQKQGYEIERTANGFELKGLDKETLDKFSRRTQEIEEHAKAHGITDDKKKDQIGARTREAKRSISDNEQMKEWRQRLTEAEYEKIKNLRKSSTSANDNGNVVQAREALKYSLDHHLERKSVASDKEILATAIKSSIGRTSPELVKNEFEADKNILSVKENLRMFVTVKDALREERQLIEHANSLKGKFKPINAGYEISSDYLNDQQRKAVKHALGSQDGLILLTGKAGVGKTTLMREVKKGINASGKSIFSFAPSSEASRVVQREEGFDHADTVASLIKNKDRHKEFKNQVLWIDEAGMLSNKDMNRIIEIGKAQNARIILSGDTRQHGSVERGDAMRVIQKHAKINSATVNKIQRQQNAGYRDAVKYLSDGDVERGFKKLDSIGAIKEIEDSRERVKAIAEDYYQAAHSSRKIKNVHVVAPTHAEGDAVTREIRQKLKTENVLSNNERELTVFKNKQLTEAEKSRAENYENGDVLFFHQNVKGIKAGSSIKITSRNEKNLIGINDKGEQKPVDVGLAGNYSVYEERKIMIGTGDRLRITNNGKAMEGLHLFNGTAYNVTGFDRQGNIRLSNGSTLPANYGHFAHGYVTTSHSSQGKTADKVIISQSSMSFKASSAEQFYVSVSRGRQAVSIYTDDKEHLMQAVNNSSQRISATELMEKRGKEQQMNKPNSFERMRVQAVNSYNNFRNLNSRNNELPGKVRTR